MKMIDKTFVYISSWDKSSDGSDHFGITGYRFDKKTGEMQLVDAVERRVLFNIACFDKNRGIVYALNEENDLPGLRGGGGGRIFAFHVDPDSGKLTELCRKETWCPSPSYLSLDQSGKYLIVSNHGSKAAVTKIGQDAYGNYYPMVEYDDAVVELFSVTDDGRIDRLLDVVKHYGNGPEKRQTIAHPHSVVMSPSGKLFAVCDKGNDTVRMYGLDAENGKLIRPTYIYKHVPGSLPRYCVFHPEKPWFYNNNENSREFFSFCYDEDGRLDKINVCDVMCPDGEMQERILEQQGLVMDRQGRYIYNVVRGPNIVTVLEIDQVEGSVQPVQHLKIDGMWPRGCALSPDGKFLLVCCRDSGEVIVLAVHEDGRLSDTGKRYLQNNAAFALFCEL